MVVTNFSDKLDVGVAFQLAVRDIPVRRGIVVVMVPAMMVWFENKSAKRAPGESQDLYALHQDLPVADIAFVKLGPVPGIFDTWLKRVPSPIRIMCGNPRARPGPRKVVPATNPEGFIHPDLMIQDAPPADDDSPGCTPPCSNERSIPITAQLAQIRVAIDMLDEKMSHVLRVLKRLRRESENE